MMQRVLSILSILLLHWMRTKWSMFQQFRPNFQDVFSESDDDLLVWLSIESMRTKRWLSLTQIAER